MKCRPRTNSSGSTICPEMKRMTTLAGAKWLHTIWYRISVDHVSTYVDLPHGLSTVESTTCYWQSHRNSEKCWVDYLRNRGSMKYMVLETVLLFKLLNLLRQIYIRNHQRYTWTEIKDTEQAGNEVEMILIAVANLVTASHNALPMVEMLVSSPCSTGGGSNSTVFN